MLSFPEYMTCAETLQDYWFGPVVFISGNNVMLLIVLGVTISCNPLLQKAYSQHFNYHLYASMPWKFNSIW